MKQFILKTIALLFIPFAAFAGPIQTMQFEGDLKTNISADVFAKQLVDTEPDRWSFMERPQARVAVVFQLDDYNDIASIEIKTLEAQDHRFHQLHFRGHCGGGIISGGKAQTTTPRAYRKLIAEIYREEMTEANAVPFFSYKGNCKEFLSIKLRSPVGPVGGTAGDFWLYVDRKDSSVKVYIATLDEEGKRVYDLITGDSKTFKADRN